MDTDPTALTKKERARQAIEQAAYELFMEQGFTRLPCARSRAGRAGVGGIYNHYAGKEEIFRAIILDRHPINNSSVGCECQRKTPEEFFRNAAREALNELGQASDFLKLMFIEVVEFTAGISP